MFQALANYLIPGLNKAIRILLLSQVEAESELEKSDQNAMSSLDFVVKGDKDKVLIKEQHDRMSLAYNSVATETDEALRLQNWMPCYPIKKSRQFTTISLAPY